MTHRGIEIEIELTTIKRLEALGYQHIFRMAIEHSWDEVVLKDLL